MEAGPAPVPPTSLPPLWASTVPSDVPPPSGGSIPPSAASLFVRPAGFRVIVLSLFSGIGGLEHSLVGNGFNGSDVLVLAFESSAVCRLILASIDITPASSIISQAQDSSGTAGPV